MLVWLLLLKVSLVVVVVAVVALVLPRPLWAPLFSQALLAIGIVGLVVAAVGVLRGLLRAGD
jgi:hypothetical protein